MQHQEPLKQIKLWQPFVIMVGAILFVVWGINAMNTGNPFWFLPIQPTYVPAEIIIHHYGEEIVLVQGDAEFERLRQALDASFASFDNNELIDLGMSKETIARYQNIDLVLEIRYSQPIRFNTPIQMVNVDKFIIPIDGRHDGQRFLFMGSGDIWLAGVLQMSDDTALLNVMQELGYIRD